MVAHIKHLIATILLLTSTLAWAQGFAITDTTTEYPHKGTFYHDRFEGRKTASGEIFDQNLFTAAHWRIKLGTYVLVTNQNTGLQVIVKINDRCPRHGVLDMTHRAANAIGIRGCQPVTLRIVSEDYVAQWAMQDQMFDSVRTTLSPTITHTLSPTLEALQPPSQAQHNNLSNSQYNISLARITNHSQAFAQIQKLPVSLQNKIVIEPLEGSDSLHLFLEVKQAKTSAEQLLKALRSNFPDGKLLLAD